MVFKVIYYDSEAKNPMRSDSHLECSHIFKCRNDCHEILFTISLLTFLSVGCGFKV